MDRIIIARFPSLLEAEAAVTCLEAGEIEALLDDRIAGALMPHASEAFGGFTVSVPEADKARALELLGCVEQPEPAEPPSADRETDLTMRRATYGAVLGAIFLPIIANFFSLAMYGKAFSRNPERFWKRKWLFFFGMFFNAIVFGGVMILAWGMLAARKEDSAVGSCFTEAAPPALRVKDCAAVAGYATDYHQRASALGTMGILHARMGDLPAAIGDFGRVLDSDPNSAAAHADRAIALAVTGDMTRALLDLKEAIRLDPTDPAPRNNRCFLLALNANYAEALRDCDAAEKIARESREHAREVVGIHDVRGLVNLKAGHLEAALADFNEALKHDPHLATSLFGRGLVERQLGKAANAEADINLAIAIDQDVEKNFGTIGHIAQKL